ncbi:BTB/POZ domain-containing protein At4g30940-like [Cucurbita moschata]|uniref:BTB/POZ domain-containing protein At4g30940-like n=1 Tax=Cucurbita moschata TaxID=3662 RepID=A0A6J1G3M9_CUCMO|nr:BTB/POZ domain-containing protein At4g30940-like [Cucurbita moschata]XP_022946389.1 BTB/POZ domain-containing protein At4g30940-like [Cucurbita moschata]XP_022946390.1 BTB/POZ domain-containing protein At4g30940-like [Cucurbita moschata]
MVTQKRKVRFNVGGKIFETTATTLSNASENSLFKAMLDGAWTAQYEEFGEYFIDRDPACFHVLLHLLQTGELLVPPTIPDTLLCREAHYYGLLDQVLSARSVELDGENLKLASSITGRTLLQDHSIIRASANGSCSIANGRVFHVYDWMLQELSIANLDYMKIVDMEWYDSTSILISGRKHSNPNTGGDGGGGIGLFNPQTAKLQHKFKLTQTSSSSSRSHGGDNQFSRTTPGNLAINNSNDKIFCCCKHDSYTKVGGIGVWDTTTGQQIDFLEGGYNSGLHNTFKLQWLPSNKCLVAAIRSPQSNRISIFDPRMKEMHSGHWEHNPYKLKHRGALVDAMGIEEMNCVCVIDENGFFGFFDLRGLGGESQMNRAWWSSEEEEKRERFPLPGEMVHIVPGGKPKLGWHGGKLFCSTNSAISVYCGSGFEWELASQVEPKNGGFIQDFSIGGDRLFSLHALQFNHYNINVWETPPSPLPPLFI